MRIGNFAVVIKDGTKVPVEITKSLDGHEITVAPIDGHMGDGREPEETISIGDIEASFFTDLGALVAAGFELDEAVREKMATEGHQVIKCECGGITIVGTKECGCNELDHVGHRTDPLCVEPPLIDLNERRTCAEHSTPQPSPSDG